MNDEEIERSIIESIWQTYIYSWNELMDDKNVRKIMSTVYGIEDELKGGE